MLKQIPKAKPIEYTGDLSTLPKAIQLTPNDNFLNADITGVYNCVDKLNELINGHNEDFPQYGNLMKLIKREGIYKFFVSENVDKIGIELINKNKREVLLTYGRHDSNLYQKRTTFEDDIFVDEYSEKKWVKLEEGENSCELGLLNKYIKKAESEEISMNDV